jgi:hypothetical protein
MNNIANRAKKVLKQIHYATIATSPKDGKPWNSPVAHVYDDDLNFYWFSDKESRRSQNVRENENIFIVIYDSTVTEGQDYTRPADDFLGNAVRRAYKAAPKQVWMNGAKNKEGVFTRDYRVEIPMERLKGDL